MKDPEILSLYSEYLIASFNLTTATGMSELLNDALSHDKISRFLGQRHFTQTDYWKCIKPIIRKVESDHGIIKIDDVIEHKPHSTENEIICWHWDHSKKPQAGLVKGINILNFLYESPLGEASSISIPLAYEVVHKTEEFYDKKSGKVKRRSSKTKNAMVRQRLSILQRMNKVKYRYVTWDTWYSSNDNFKFVHYELEKQFIAALKDNRLVALSKEDKLEGKCSQVKELDVPKDQAITVWIKGLDFPVSLTRQVFTNKDGTLGELYVVTNDLNLTSQVICDTYDKRWGVEVFHKGLKQNVGLEKSPTKNETTQLNHIFAAMVAWAKLELLSIKTKCNHFALKKRLYVKALEAAFVELQHLKGQQQSIPLLE